MKILVIDNYDSFTYNLVHFIEQVVGEKPAVFRNDELQLIDVAKFDKICISPGPGLPKDSGVCVDVVKQFSSIKNILGVCLGHQVIGEVFGSTLVNLPHVMHGIARTATVLKDDALFTGLPVDLMCARYHSWGFKEIAAPLECTANDEEGYVMALRHPKFNVRGVQFHPESILTPHGYAIIKNWITLT